MKPYVEMWRSHGRSFGKLNNPTYILNMYLCWIYVEKFFMLDFENQILIETIEVITLHRTWLLLLYNLQFSKIKNLFKNPKFCVKQWNNFRQKFSTPEKTRSLKFLTSKSLRLRSITGSPIKFLSVPCENYRVPVLHDAEHKLKAQIVA